MATQIISISEKSLKILKDIVKVGGKVDAASFDKRSIRALAARKFVKTTENKNGSWVLPTAAGKKFLN